MFSDFTWKKSFAQLNGGGGGGGRWVGVVPAPFLYGPVKWQLAGNSTDCNPFTFDFEKYMPGMCVFKKCFKLTTQR